MRTDEEVVAQIKDLMAKHPDIMRTTLMKGVGLGEKRLLRLEKEGHFKLPRPLSNKQSAQRNAAKSSWGKGFRLKGTPV